MSCGIAHEGQLWSKSSAPHPLPVQALDHATGYLMAACILSALRQGLITGQTCDARLSLARTAVEVMTLPVPVQEPLIREAQDTDFAPDVEASGWGPAHRLTPPLQIAETRFHWTLPSGPLGRDKAEWAD